MALLHSGLSRWESYALWVTDILSTSELSATRDGLTQLRRHWEAPNPRVALLLVHGIGEHCGRYEHVGAHLAAKGIDVLAFDNRGFGQSGGRRAFVNSFDEYLDDVEDLLAKRRELGLPVVLMGHSLGGLIVSNYLESDRPEPDFAVLSAPALAAIVPRWQRILAPILGRITPKFFIKSTIEGELLSRDKAVQDAYLSDPLVIAGSTARLGAEIFSTMETTSAAINRITVPTYVFHGGQDNLVPTASSESLGRLSNVTRRVWEGLRHESLNEPEQDEVMAEIVTWVLEQLG